jgi:transcriptional regulator with XRE-family HTH domain
MGLVERIKTLCDNKDTTLIGLEREIGIGRGTIRNWDKNSPSVDKINKVAQYFNVSVDFLLNGSVGNIFAERRRELKMSISELANSVGVTPEYIEGLENGSVENPPVGLLSQIAETLQLSGNDDTIYVPNEKYGERHIKTRGYAEINGIPVVMILVSEAEEKLIKRFCKLSPDNQKLLFQFLDGLEIMDKGKNEQAGGGIIER